MYQPRRALAPMPDEPVATPVPEAFSRPRRAAATWRDHLGQRAGVGLVAIAAVATSGAVVLGGGQASAAGTGVAAAAIDIDIDRDAAPLSRSANRPAQATLQLRPLATSKLAEATEDLVALTPLYTTAELNIRAEPSESAKKLGSLDFGTKVIATGSIEGRYRKVSAGKLEGWVLAKNLSDETAELAAGITMAACSRGSAVERRLRNDTIKIYRSLCALFPGVNSYGGWRAGGRQFHKNGRALDIMLTPGRESAMGWQIAKYLTANARAFNIDHVIFEQKIWTPRSPHWRGMADRGGTTANHYDHVHVAVRA